MFSDQKRHHSSDCACVQLSRKAVWQSRAPQFPPSCALPLVDQVWMPCAFKHVDWKTGFALYRKYADFFRGTNRSVHMSEEQEEGQMIWRLNNSSPLSMFTQRCRNDVSKIKERSVTFSKPLTQPSPGKSVFLMSLFKKHHIGSQLAWSTLH